MQHWNTVTNSRCGSGRPKNIQILKIRIRIRIRNTGKESLRSHKTLEIRVFLTFFAWWRKDPDLYVWLTDSDADPRGLKTYGSVYTTWREKLKGYLWWPRSWDQCWSWWPVAAKPHSMPPQFPAHSCKQTTNALVSGYHIHILYIYPVYSYLQKITRKKPLRNLKGLKR
jgi:hypothetical protein